MCGILGTTKPYTKEVLNRKLNTMRFRGPDFQGLQSFDLKTGGILSLGHVRLSILDLDKRSNQPFRYNDNITVVYNGEIYNYAEIKKQYLADVTFRTSSDTEVLCAMYDKFGYDCVSFFNGMFAFVIYDKKKNILFGARDRLGKKPFYYYLTSDSFEFASQLAPLCIQNDFHINDLARQFYLLNGYIPDPECIFKEVKKLRAGHRFVLSLLDYQMKIDSYWDIFTNSCKFRAPQTYDEARETVKELLFDSVRIRLNADVPVGLFLSGGIDSSLVSAVASRFNSKITAYTIGFDDPKYDESNYASEIANSIGINFKTTKCEGAELQNSLEGLMYYYDEPFADFSLIPTCLLTKKTRENVTVALGGDGADELFLGYYNHYVDIENKISINRHFSHKIRKMAFNVLSSNPCGYHFSYIKYDSGIDAFIGEGRYGQFYGAERFCRESVAKLLPDNSYFNEKRGILKYSDNDIKHYMNSCINTKTDRASMRYSLELRSPMMDYRLAEYSRLLPFDFMYDENYGGKRILKDILYEMVPRDLLERPKKGFSPPINQWFRGDLKELLYSFITKDNIESMIPDIDSNKIIKLRDDFLKGKRISALPFLKIYLYMQWYCIYVNNNYRGNN